MGMYTELIFGAELKHNTPNDVIDTIKYMVGQSLRLPKDCGLPSSVYDNLFRTCNYSFGIKLPVRSFVPDGAWQLSTRSAMKNYNGEIKTFLEWIKPWIASGSGNRDMYAIVIYEDENEPTIHYLRD